jgi:hypothetical protein
MSANVSKPTMSLFRKEKSIHAESIVKKVYSKKKYLKTATRSGEQK